MRRIGFGMVAFVLLGCTSTEVVCGEGTYQEQGVCIVRDGQTTDISATDTPTTTSTRSETTTTTSGTTTSTASTSTGTSTATITDTTTGTGTTSTSTTGTTSSTTGVADNVVHVYLLGGQSNASGFGQVDSLPPALQISQEDVRLYWSQEPWWKPLSPASEYTSGAQAYFGPEVTMGRALADASPDVPVVLIKHTVGGTDLQGFWNPSTGPEEPDVGPGYRVFYQTVVAGLEALEAEGWAPEVKGMAWMQGEADALMEGAAATYEENLTAFIGRVRDDVGAPEMPFVAGLIDCRGLCPFREDVRAATLAVAASSSLVQAIETIDLGTYPYDGWHYQGTGQRVLGTRFAAAFAGETLPSMPSAAVRLTGVGISTYSGDFTVGWAFETDREITITDLGRYDLDYLGLRLGAEVAVWDDTTQALLMSAWVPGALASDVSYQDGFRYVAVAPKMLPAGRYVITNQTYDATPLDYIWQVSIEEAPGVQWLEGRHRGGSAMIFPDTIMSADTSSALWFGPNFLFDE